MPSYFLRSGTLALVAQTPERHLVGFWHVNDLLETDQLAPFPALFIRALEPSELWRLPQPAAKVLLDGDSEARKDYLAQCATMLKRLAITNAMLARLSGRQRVASFLIACAVRHGYIAGNRADIPLPMSRADIADHLGLNPDTLSRLMAHMQRADLIELHGRRHLLAKDWGALCQESPIAPAILATG